MRLKLRLEFYSFLFDVPDDEDFVIGCLCDDVGIHRTPAYRGDVLVCKSQQLGQLEGLLVVNMDG